MSFVPRSSLVVAIEVRSPSISRPHETARLPLLAATLVPSDRAEGYHSKVGIPADRSLPVLPSHGGFRIGISTRLRILGVFPGLRSRPFSATGPEVFRLGSDVPSGLRWAR